MKNIVFVCTGNTCRSPMAEGLFNMLAEKEGLPFRAVSCGLFPDAGAAPSAFAVEAAKELGADILGHRAKPCTEELLADCCAVYCMTSAHAEQLSRAFPAFADIIRTMPPSDISDPYGGGLDMYRTAAAQILRSLRLITQELK
ncbi:MAG: low molecular weight phosphatase family protein [Oscillospiraceae bacterium]|nr:low molecular weight phosphatase family protein [Oscillospiraceae bacterium]